MMARVTGLGGIFYKVSDPAVTADQYKENLGLGGEWGIHFPWSRASGDDSYRLLSEFKV